MIENILAGKNLTKERKLTLKALISVILVAAATVLPQIVHAFAGAQGGAKLLPMYLPVALGACILGVKWGALVGVSAPLVSFMLTSLFGNAMPAAARVPFMVAELAVLALVCGAFSKKICENNALAFVALPVAFAASRCTFLLMSVLFSGVIPPAAAISQISSGIFGVLLQCIIAPVVVIIIGKLTKEGK